MTNTPYSIFQPTAEQFDFEATSRWDDDGGALAPSTLPDPLKTAAEGQKLRWLVGASAILGSVFVENVLALACACTSALGGAHHWLITSDARLARDAREYFAVGPAHPRDLSTNG